MYYISLEIQQTTFTFKFYPDLKINYQFKVWNTMLKIIGKGVEMNLKQHKWLLFTCYPTITLY